MTTAIARRRVESLLAAARHLSDPATEIGHEARVRLPAVTGLSPENVALALTHHLETAADESLFTSVAREDEARVPTVHVVLSANVFIAALRALCLAAVRGNHVVLVPSRREPVFSELLLRALDDRSYLSVSSTLAARSGDEVHAYGSDETLARIAADLPADCALWRHGNGLGVVAQIDGRDVDVDALADDVVIFDQRGCLSPKIVIIRHHGEALARALAKALHERLSSLPLGSFDEVERTAALFYRASMEAVGLAFGQPGALVGLVQDGTRFFAPAAARSVHVVESAALAPFLHVHAPLFTCLAGDDEETAAVLPLARRAVIGCMQRPPLDGPVDRRQPPPLPVETRTQLAR